jgi:hypothetical protein
MDNNILNDNTPPQNPTFDPLAEAAQIEGDIISRGSRVALDVRLDADDRYFTELVVQIGASTGDADGDFTRAVDALTRALGEPPAEVRRHVPKKRRRRNTRKPPAKRPPETKEPQASSAGWSPNAARPACALNT